MHIYPFRLHPGEKIKAKIKTIIDEFNIGAGTILSAVGSLHGVTVRLADNKIKEFTGRYEIVSLVGTLSQNGTHLHISFSDHAGQVFGGHFKEGTVYTTCELIIGKFDHYRFVKEPDPATGFEELTIYRNKIKLI